MAKATVTKQEVVKCLRTAKKLVEAGWVKEAWATNAEGKEVAVMGKTAENFCASGAIERAARQLASGKAKAALLQEKAEEVFRNSGTKKKIGKIPEWNDMATRQKSHVLTAFARAIEHVPSYTPSKKSVSV
jgi:hypothetical protein